MAGLRRIPRKHPRKHAAASSRRNARRLLAALAVLCALAGRSAAREALTRVEFRSPVDGVQRVEGKVLVEAVEKSFLLLGRDGRIWSVLPDQVADRQTVDEPYTPLTRDELAEALVAEFGEGFEVIHTAHYVICANTDRKYANWCGVLFELWMTAFRSQWRNLKVEMHEPEMPLVAVVFADRRDFADYATRDHGPETAKAQGY